MKHFKKILSIMAALVLCLTPLFAVPMTANATENAPVTYYLKYVPSLSQFRYQHGSWVEGQEHWDIALMKLNIKDGDLVVIDDTENAGIKLEVNVTLDNVTVVHGNNVVVAAKSIKDFYALNGSTSAISGNITNAYVYDNSLANFNSNVKNLSVINSKGDLLESTVAVAGTCDHVIASGKSYKHFELYNFKANTLLIDKGTLKTAAGNYSTTPSASSPSTSSDSEYDDVPKTADNRFNPLWLLGLFVVCSFGGVAIRKMK